MHQMYNFIYVPYFKVSMFTWNSMRNCKMSGVFLSLLASMHITSLWILEKEKRFLVRDKGHFITFNRKISQSMIISLDCLLRPHPHNLPQRHMMRGKWWMPHCWSTGGGSWGQEVHFSIIGYKKAIQSLHPRGRHYLYDTVLSFALEGKYYFFNQSCWWNKDPREDSL